MDHTFGEDRLPRPADLSHVLPRVGPIDDDVKHFICRAGETDCLFTTYAPHRIDPEHTRQLVALHAIKNRLITDGKQKTALSTFLLCIMIGL